MKKNKILPKFFNKDVNQNLLVLFSLLLLASFVIMLFSIYVLQSLLSSSYKSENTRQEEYYYWSEKADEFSSSPDVLYNAAVASLNVRKDETALKLLNKAIRFDPLFNEAKELRDRIVENSR